jgi:hypothetical protein
MLLRDKISDMTEKQTDTPPTLSLRVALMIVAYRAQLWRLMDAA